MDSPDTLNRQNSSEAADDVDERALGAAADQGIDHENDMAPGCYHHFSNLSMAKALHAPSQAASP